MFLNTLVVVAMILPAADKPPTKAGSHVAILSCKDFYYPNANFAFTAETCLETLHTCGVPAEQVTPEDIQQASVFNAERYPVLLNLYGDAYPATVLDSLRRYHRAGGCIISNGVPFGFACHRNRQEWQGEYLPEERSARKHDGMGTGSWSRIEHPTSIQWTLESSKRPFRLNSFHPETTRISTFYGLNPASLPEQDTVIPLITVGNGKQTAIALGLIEHHCEPFDGAIDLWAGSHLFSEPRHNVIRTQEEIFVRGCAYLMEKRGAITAEQRSRIDEAMDRRLVRHPADPDHWPVPAISAISPTQRIIPVTDPPAGCLDAVDLRDDGRTLQQTALSLAGLANRMQARLFIICQNTDTDWLTYLAKESSPQLKTTTISLDEAFQKYADAYDGAVIPPDTSELFCGSNIAIMAASAKNLVIASRDTADRYHLPVREDLRGRWTTSKQAYDWVNRECATQLSDRIAAVCSPEKWLLTDYLVAHRVYTLWITGPRDAAEPGGNTWNEIQLAYDRLAGMPLHAPVLGFGHHGRYRGLGESEVVEIVSRFAKFQMVTNKTPNLSVYSAFPRQPLRQKRRKPPVFNPSRVYVAMVISDGDNLNYWYDRFPKLWKDPARGTFPLGWSIGPSGLDLEPSMYRRIYQQATENDCFVAAVSGLGYIYPEIYGDGYTDSRVLLDEYLQTTRTQMDLMDLRTVHIHHHGPYGGTSRQTLEHCAEKLDAGQTDLLFVGYGRHEWFPPEPGKPRCVKGVPLVYAATSGKPDESIQQIVHAAGDHRPAFVCAHITPWRFRPSAWKQEFASLGSEYVLVTPEELGQFVKQSTACNK